jgi:ABC-type cobalamin/Fe3+-siderophores transport system ATPase subunit
MVFITQRLLWPLTRLGETFDLYQRGMASTRRILDLLEVPPRIVDGDGEVSQPVAGDVELDNIDFAYGDGALVLKGVSLHVPAGQTHAIVGATGAGKSTIVKLLLRLYDPTAGRVLLDGTDIRSLSFAELRGVTGFVSQDVFLFAGTVRDNIAYGRPEATDDQVRSAAQLAEAHGFVSALPHGYDTVVGERGQKLSGGQRQRLSIARAILTDPRVFILDEATSAVDNETEAAIQRSLERVARQRTTIVIAHRLSTIRGADRIHAPRRPGGRVGRPRRAAGSPRPLRGVVERADRRGVPDTRPAGELIGCQATRSRAGTSPSRAVAIWSTTWSEDQRPHRSMLCRQVGIAERRRCADGRVLRWWMTRLRGSCCSASLRRSYESTTSMMCCPSSRVSCSASWTSPGRVS